MKLEECKTLLVACKSHYQETKLKILVKDYSILVIAKIIHLNQITNQLQKKYQIVQQIIGLIDLNLSGKP